MDIKRCENCGGQVQIEEEYGETRARCLYCGTTYMFPLFNQEAYKQKIKELLHQIVKISDLKKDYE